MEHLLLPKQPTPPAFKVPYVCQAPYDGGLFSEYPARTGRSWMLPIADGATASLRFLRHFSAEPTKQQESFYQQWLFFGLLSAMLGPLYREEDYWKEENGAKFVTTEKLIPNMEEAGRTRVKTGAAEAREQFLRVINCIRIIWKVINLGNDDFDWRVKLSIVSVASFFAEATNMFLEAKGISTNQVARVAWTHNFPDAISRSQMLAYGWCPCEIAGNIERFKSLHTLFFLSRINRSYLQRSHEQCTEKLCKLYQIDPAVYETKHAGSCRTCPSIPADARKVFDILRTGALPLIKVIIDDKDNVKIEMIASKAESRYIAISHVWADGLGNPNANALPSCQLRRLKQLATELCARDSQLNKDGELIDYVLFWIDTLCCPVEQGFAKNLSIERIRDTYAHASAVLVLDFGLQQISYDNMHPVEAALSILTSGWTQRLWTLQEGALANSDKLWVQFQDGPQNMDSLFAGLGAPIVDSSGIPMIQARTSLIRSDMRVQFGAGIRRMESLMDPQRHGQDLMLLDRGLIHRSVSVPSDEPLCIATLLGLSLEEVLKVKVGDEATDHLGQLRMCRVWQLVDEKLKGIPEGILALSYPRLKVKGFRWAPSTLLEANNKLFREGRWILPGLAKLTKHGLRVEYEGFLLHFSPLEDSSAPDISRTLEGAQIKGLIPITAGETRYWVVANDYILHSRTAPKLTYPLLGDIFDKDLAIIKIPGVSTSAVSEALLGNVHQLSSNEFVFSQISPIHLHHSFPGADTIYESGKEIMKLRREHRRYIETFKCVEAVNSDLESKTIHLVRIALLEDSALREAMRIVFNVEGDVAVNGLVRLLATWLSYDTVADELETHKIWYVD